MKDGGITMIPEVEPILLGLENPFLLSVSFENSNFQGQNGKNEIVKTFEKYFLTF